ncbi:MAG TPA: S8 family serine peptidase [Anaerolineae bacterium]|nr:S8 family serine peptidase [Anaerolineae bacterium]
MLGLIDKKQMILVRFLMVAVLIIVGTGTVGAGEMVEGERPLAPLPTEIATDDDTTDEILREEEAVLGALAEGQMNVGAESQKIWAGIEAAYMAGDWAEIERLAQLLPADERWERAMTFYQMKQELEVDEREVVVEELVITREEEQAMALAEDERVARDEAAVAVRAEVNRNTRTEEGLVPTGEAVAGAVRTVGDSCTYATVQAAVSAAVSGDVIRVQGRTWTGSAATVNVTGKNLFFYGGYNATCSALDGSRTVLDGSGSIDSVVEVYGTTAVSVLFDNFTLTGGSNDADYGGGLEISNAAHTVTLNDTYITSNSSTYGGGVHLSDGSTLIVQDGSLIYSNSATADGGGVYCLDSIVTVRNNAYVGFWFFGALPNIADSDGVDGGNGGGLYLDGCTFNLDATNNNASVIVNQAVNGGGVYARNSSFINVDGSRAQVASNEATTNGGGFYLFNSDVYVDNGAIVDNIAATYGGGFYAISGSVVDLDNQTAATTCFVDRCVQVSGNSAGSYGGAAYVYNNAELDAQTVFMDGNTGSLGSAVYGRDNAWVQLYSVMVTDGTATSDYALRLFSSGTTSGVSLARVLYSTFAGGAGQEHTFGLDNRTSLDGYGLIVWNDSTFGLIDGPGDAVIDCSVLAYDYPGADNVVADPIFLNEATGNYHIGQESPAIDKCRNSWSLDVDGEPRPGLVAGQGNFELPSVVDHVMSGKTYGVQLLPSEWGEVALTDVVPTAIAAHDYGSYVWVELDESGYERLVDSGLPFTTFEGYGELRIGSNYRFDPLFDGEPQLREGWEAVPTSAEGEWLQLVQLAHPLTAHEEDILEAHDVVLVEYVPHLSYLVWGDASTVAALQEQTFVRWQGDYRAGYRVSPRLEAALAAGETVLANASWVDDGHLPAVEARLNQAGMRIVDRQPRHMMGEKMGRENWVMRLTAGQLAHLLAEPGLIYVDIQPQWDIEDERSAVILAGLDPDTDDIYDTWLADTGYTGAGVLIAISDTGVDWDHPDLNVVSGNEYGGYSESGEPGSDGAPDANNNGRGSGHGTHVAGIVGGNGSSGTADSDGFIYGYGVAPGVSLHAQDAIAEDSGASTYQMIFDAASAGAAASNNSWGGSAGQGYTAFASAVDDYTQDAINTNGTVRDRFLPVFSAGNSGPGASTITEPKEAKNPLVVGNSWSRRSSTTGTSGNIETMANGSSRGPALDGRIRPDVAAPGSNIISTENRSVDVGGEVNVSCAFSPSNSTQHSFCSGTSMAAPHVSGVVALFNEFWQVRNDTSAVPDPALVKAAIINTTDNMTGATDRPSADQGWGRVNADRLLNPPVPVRYYENPDLFNNNGEYWELEVTVEDTNEPLRVSLVWMDAPGAADSNPALVNNLNLRVIDPNASIWRGNVFSNGWSQTGGAYDNLNNVENVWIENPIAGTYIIRVSAVTLAGDGFYFNGDGTDQNFSLVCYNCNEDERGTYDAGADEAYAFVGLNGATCGYGTIGDAIAAASSGDTVYVPRGYYGERIGIIDKDLTIVGSVTDCTAEDNSIGSYDVTIDANDAPTTYGGVVQINNGATVTMTNLYLRDGTATYGGIAYVNSGGKLILDDTDLGYGSSDTFGGLVRVYYGTLEMYNGSIMFNGETTGSGVGAGIAGLSSTIRLYNGSDVGFCGAGFMNVSAGNGGGVFMENGYLYLYDTSRVCGNEALSNGGGVYAEGGARIYLYDNSDIGSSSLTSGNVANIGGGVYLTGTARLYSYANTTIAYNSAAYGAGIAMYGDSLVDINNGAIVHNQASNQGGGLYIVGINGNSPYFLLDGGLIDDNSAAYGGGAYVFGDNITVNIDGGQISNNQATIAGGGIRYNSQGSSNVLMIQNGSLIEQNNSGNSGNGGGLAIFSDVNIDISNSTINNNSAENGGGIHLVGTTDLLMVAVNLTNNIAVADGAGLHSTNSDVQVGSTTAATVNDTFISGNIAGGNGGGIYASLGMLKLTPYDNNEIVHINNNEAGIDGGGLHLTNGAYLEAQYDIQIHDNAANNHGGGLYMSGGDAVFAHWDGTLAPRIEFNEATNGNGGGIYLTGVSENDTTVNGPFLSGATLSFNTALATDGDGGGLYVDNSAITLDGVLVNSNQAGDNGGGMVIDNNSQVTVSASLGSPVCASSGSYHCSEFVNNVGGVAASGFGGAIYLNDVVSLAMYNTVIRGNDNDFGGALYLHVDANATLNNVLVAENSSASVAVIRLANGSPDLTLNSSTVVSNTAPAAITTFDAISNVNFSNSIVWGNTAGFNNDAGSIVGGNGCNIGQDGVAGIVADPLFVTVGLEDYHLGSGSAAIDACSSAGQTYDLNNTPRPQDGDGVVSPSEYDMGVYEATCTGLAPVPAVSATIVNGSDIEFSWTSDPLAAAYNANRGDEPYASGNDNFNDISSPWSDNGVVGDPAFNYFYKFTAVNCAGESASEDIGVFNYGVTIGN